jgi:hypothetical protein
MTKLWAANTEGHSAVGRAFCTAVLLQLIIVAFSIASQGQGPALTTIEEVRYTDVGWGAENNRNLIGRYTTSSFSVTRYARAQSYFLRNYDNSVPPKYSRYSAALHVDYPL